MAYISKFTGAQIDALLDASEAMKTSKEDTANKVTSLDNPSDVTFPTSKAVVDGYNNSIAFKVDNIYSQIADSYIEHKYPYFSNGGIANSGSTNPIGYYTISQEILSQISHIRAYLECDGNLPAALTFYSSDSTFNSKTRIKAVQMQSATGAFWYESEVPKGAVCCLVVNRKDKYGDPVINVLRKDSGMPLDIARIESKIDMPMEYNEELLADLTFAESAKDVSAEIKCDMGEVIKVVADANVPYYWLGTTLYHSEICDRIDGSEPRYVVLNQFVKTLWIRRMIATAEGHIQVYKCSKKELYNYPNIVNSFFKYSPKTISADDWLIGKSHTWTGGYSNNAKRAVTKLLKIRNPHILISCSDISKYRYTLHYAYRNNGTIGYDSGWITTETYEAEPNCDIIEVMVEKLSGAAITAEDLSVINVEILNETLDDYVTSNELDSVDEKAESLKSDIASIRNVENIGLVNNRMDVTKPYYYHFQPNGFIKDGSNQSAIASQSSYDIELAARLGFTFIEANVHATQDGDFVCMHGAGGAFGDTVYSLDGTDITNTKFENVTMAWIKQNVRFNSTYSKYKVAPLSLAEFCQCCKVNGIGIFAGTNSEDAVKVCLQILGTDNVMLYNAPSSFRSIFKGMMFNWNNTTTTTIDSILATARSYGKPYMYGIGPALLEQLITDGKLGELAQKMHNEGFTLASTAVYDTDDNVQVAFEHGVDFSASGHQVNPFEPNYEVYDLDNESQFSGTATITGGQALLTTGQTLTCGKSDVIGLGKAMLVVRYSGTLKFAFGATSPKTYTSDGTKDVVLSNYFFKRNTALTITATADTTINHLVYKTSKC